MEEIKNTNTEAAVEETTGAAAAEETAPEVKTFTQAEVDELISKRIARESKKFEKKIAELQKPSEDQVSLEDENKNLKNYIASQNKRILTYEAGKIAQSLNVKSERIDAVLRLADLSAVEIDENGEFDSEEIKEKIEAIAKDYPEFLNVVEQPKKETGFVKVGTAPAEQTEIDKLRQQIEKGLGL